MADSSESLYLWQDKTRQNNVLFGVLYSPMYINFIQSYVYRLYPPPHTHACKAYFSATPKDGDTIAWLSIWLSHSDGGIR